MGIQLSHARLHMCSSQAFFQATLTELSQTSALRRQRGVIGPPDEQLVKRIERENRPTLKQWLQLKKHVEKHFYRATWAFPQGISFLT